MSKISKNTNKNNGFNCSISSSNRDPLHGSKKGDGWEKCSEAVRIRDGKKRK